MIKIHNGDIVYRVYGDIMRGLDIKCSKMSYAGYNCLAKHVEFEESQCRIITFMVVLR